MLIICPKCFTQFEVDSSMIKKSTQKFQCSNCGTVFEEHFDDVVQLTTPVVPNRADKNESTWETSVDVSHPLPEEFTPVFGRKQKNHTGTIALIVFLCAMGIGGYLWMNRGDVLQAFPNVNKGIELLSEPQEVVPPVDPLKVYEGAQTPATDTQPAEVSGEVVPNPAPAVLSAQAIETPALLENVSSDDKPVMPAPQVADTTVSAAVANAPVQIKDVVFRYDDTGTDNQRLFVQGIVTNVMEEALPMPALQAQLYDKDDVLLGVRDLPYTARTLNAKMAEFFFAEIQSLPNNIVKRVSVVLKGK